MATETVKALKAHIAINVKDVQQSINFYRKMFGIEPSKVRARVCEIRCQQSSAEFHVK